MLAKNKKILIFPGGMSRSLEFLEICQRDGREVVGSSSIEDDPAKGLYPAWKFLPYIVDPNFDDVLKRLVEECNIEGIYSPNPVVWHYLDKVLDDLVPGVALINDSPVAAQLSPYRTARKFAESLITMPPILDVSRKGKPKLTRVEIASLFRHSETIPGMCDHEKMRALHEIARYSPAGDIVEIGSWWGKSAFILLRLAQCYSIGKVLCVDPWSDSELVQNEELVDAASAQCDAEEAFDVFKTNLLPYAAQGINYLKMPSIEGAQYYRRYRMVETVEFGSVAYSGRISVLHIDGNHGYEAVSADIAAWSPLVEKHGWIVVDDYVWPYGDGPRRAGDEFKALNAGKIGAALVMGGALFMELSAEL